MEYLRKGKTLQEQSVIKSIEIRDVFKIHRYISSAFISAFLSNNVNRKMCACRRAHEQKHII